MPKKTTTTTNERMAVIETEIKNINKNLDTQREEQNEKFETVFNKIDELKKEFAGKWVEKVTVGTLIAVIAGIVLFILQKKFGG